MKYEEFCTLIESKVEGLKKDERSVSSFMRTAYESMPKDLNPQQQQAYASVWVSGYQSGKLGANMRSRELLSGLGKVLAERPTS